MPPGLGESGAHPALSVCTQTSSNRQCFAPKGTAWCSPSARGAFRCRASFFPCRVVCSHLPGSALPAPALLPMPSALPGPHGAEWHRQGDKGLQLSTAIPCSRGLAENYCLAREENNILFAVSPGTCLRFEQALAYRLQRDAKMQNPATSIITRSSPRLRQSLAAVSVLAPVPTLAPSSAVPPGCPQGQAGRRRDLPASGHCRQTRQFDVSSR